MPSIGRHRTSSLGRSVKRQVIRRLSSCSLRAHPQSEHHVPLLLPLTENITSDFNTSALTEPSFKAMLRPGATFTPFSGDSHMFSVTKIPQAPPLPTTFTEKVSSETLKSTEFTKGIKSRTSSITPSGTDLSQSMLIRPSQITEPPPIIQMAKSKTYANPITKCTFRNRRRTPLTPDVLALTKLRHPEHIKSSIAQRIEELKQASSINAHAVDEKLSPAKLMDVRVTCEYQNSDQERSWLKDQAQSNSSMRFLNNNHSVQLSDRRFQIRSIEFIDETTVRFFAQERFSEDNFLRKSLKQISIVTILVLSALRLIENTLSNLSIPGMQIILNLIYVFILITIAIVLLTEPEMKPMDLPGPYGYM